MALMNAKQYEESLRRLNLAVYMFGKRIENVVDDPILRPSMNAVALTYDYAHDPQYEDLLTAVSHLSGKKINRFCHIHQSVSDLVKKSSSDVTITVDGGVEPDNIAELARLGAHDFVSGGTIFYHRPAAASVRELRAARAGSASGRRGQAARNTSARQRRDSQ